MEDGDAHEHLLGAVQASLDRLCADLKRMRRLAGPVVQSAERWELRPLRQRLADLASALKEAQTSTERAQAELAGFTLPVQGPNVEVYARALEQAAREQHLDLTGGFPQYEVFPLTVKVDLQGEQIVIGRKRLATLDPRTLMGRIGRDVKRLLGSSFNTQRFMRDLVTCHGYIRASDPREGRGVPLSKIHELLQMGPGTYNRQDFAFDIFRLRRESLLVYGKHRLVFGHGRGAPYAIPSARGNTELFTTLELHPVDEHA